MKIDSEEEAIFIAERKEWGVRSVSKLNRAYPIVSCRGRVYLPEDTKQTVFGRADLAPAN